MTLSGTEGYCLICNPYLTETQGALTDIEYLSTPTNTKYFSNGVLENTADGGVITLDTINVYRKIATYDGKQKSIESYDKNNDKVIVDLERFGETYPSYIHYDGKHQIEDVEDYYGLLTVNEYTSKGFREATYVTLVDSDSDGFWDYRVCTEPDINEETGLENTSTDACGATTEFKYDELCRMTQKLKAPFVCNYEYNQENDLLKKVFSDESSNEFSYHSGSNYLKSIGQNNYEYTFDYDPLGALAKITAGDAVLAEYSHNYNDPHIVTTVHETDGAGNQKTVRIFYDAHGNPTKKQINGTDTATALYDSRGNVRQIVDKLRNLCYNYEYNKDGTVKKVVMSETDTAKSYTKEYTYDSGTNRLTKTKDFATGIEYSPVYKSIKTTVDGTTTYRMDPSDTVVGVEVTGKFTDKTELDPLGRPEKRTLTLASQSNPFLTDTYAYKTFQYGSGNKSALVIVGEQKQEYRVVENGESSTKTATWHYAYDADIDEDTGCLLYNTGNIKSESGTGIDDVEYTYDNLNRLIQEDRGNRLTTVTYDNYGNILTKYCNDGTSYTFGYGKDTGWKDLLTSINGQRVFYDGCYNPTYYRTFIFEWNNIRQLTWCRNTDGNALKDTTFAYGSDGIRCRKNNIYYTLDGNRILKEYNQDTGKTITYLYGEKGIVGFNYNGNDYYYRKDIHGDVLAIYNANGKVVASYQYDAWGKLIGQTDNSGINLATVNPIRYRSYYYDTETGFYYLESRYYDPEIGRFLNADTLDYLGDGEDLKNLNSFTYCSNNPVNYRDDNGHLSFFVAIGLGIAAQYVGDVIGNLLEGDSGFYIFEPTSSIGDYISAGVTALIPGSGLESVFLRSAITQGVRYAEKAIRGESFHIFDVGLSFVKDSIIDFSTGKVSDFIDKKLKNIGPQNYSSYAGKQYKKNPAITKQQIYKKLYCWGIGIKTAQEVKTFALSSLSAAV